MKNLIPALILFSLLQSSVVHATGSIVHVRANTSTGSSLYDLWTMDSDGGGKERLTYLNATLLQFPSWSNDGTRILFDSDYNSGYTVNMENVFMYDVAKGTLSALTGKYSEPGSCPCGSISGRVYSDASRIEPRENIPVRAKGSMSVTYTDETGSYTITEVPVGTSWVRASGTGSEWSYTDTIVYAGETTTGIDLYLSDGVYYKYHPRWSPDGTRYVQESLHFTPDVTVTEIESMCLNQTGRITMSPPSYDSTVWDPDWSPAADKLVYIGWGGGLSTKDVLASDLNGSNRQRIVDCSSPYTPCSNPRWSPDGTEIAFIYNVYSIYDSSFPEESRLYLVNSDGTDLRDIYSLTGKSGWINGPVHSPDASQLMFYVYYQDETADIYRIDSDGTDLVQLTFDGLSVHPSWSMQTPPENDCALEGNEPPCGTVTLSEVISFINLWAAGEADLADVIALLNAWAA
ncbi:MAG: PD40 domain-containing protein [Candidatus Altiarchaeota archaeon]|nr:PD40 domain-containing protein [Candidatus Altiarchaeota archaeon]